MRARAEAYFAPEDDIVARLRDLLDEAERSIDACVFTITDDRLSHALLDAHRRGVRVRVVTDDLKSLDEGSDAERLRKAGLALRYDASEHHMHHKFVVFDGDLLATGSYNWTRSAARFNRENVLVTSEPRLVSRFDAEFVRLWGELAG